MEGAGIQETRASNSKPPGKLEERASWLNMGFDF